MSHPSSRLVLGALSGIFSVSGDGRRRRGCADRRRELVGPDGIDARRLFGRRGRGRARRRGLRGGGCRRCRLRGRRRVRPVTATTGDRCRQPSQNRRTRHDTRQANRIKVFHHDISNRFGLTADPAQRRGRKPLVARFIGAPVVAMAKLADSARSVFMSAGCNSHFTDRITCSGFYCHVNPQDGDGPFGFEDGQMNTVGVGVPVLAQHRL